MFIDQIKDNFSKIVSLANMNGIAITDQVASQINTIPQLNDTNAGEKFKDIVYPNIQLPGKMGKQFLDYVQKVDKTLKEYKHNMVEAFTENKKDNTDDENEDSSTDENGSPPADQKDAESSHPKSGGEVEQGTSSITKPQNVNVEKKKEENSDKDN